MANPQGKQTSRVVAENIERLRRTRGWNFAELSRRLDAAQHPLHGVVLKRIVNNERRIDVEDLTAFAQVFDTTPSQLLIPTPDSWGSWETICETPPGLLSGLPAATMQEVYAWVTGTLPNLTHAARIAWTEQTLRDLRDHLEELKREIDESRGPSLDDQVERNYLERQALEVEGEIYNYDERLAELQQENTAVEGEDLGGAPSRNI